MKREREKKEINCHTPAAKLGKYLWFCGLPVRFLPDRLVLDGAAVNHNHFRCNSPSYVLPKEEDEEPRRKST